MHKISEFARLANVSIRLLRYYDEIGLLRPKHVDADSRYRYYSVDQLLPLNRILTLKDWGFSLEEIAPIIHSKLSDEALRESLRRKQQELRQRIAHDLARLEETEVRLAALETPSDLDLPIYDVMIKTVPAVEALSAIVQLDGNMTIASIFRTIYVEMQRQGMHRAIRQIVCLYLDHRAYRRTAIHPLHVETAFVVDLWALRTVEISNGLTITPRTLPGYPSVASVLHRGDDFQRTVAHRALQRWVELHQSDVIAPVREVYLHRGLPEDHLTEVQFPIEARSAPSAQ